MCSITKLGLYTSPSSTTPTVQHHLLKFRFFFFLNEDYKLCQFALINRGQNSKKLRLFTFPQPVKLSSQTFFFLVKSSQTFNSLLFFLLRKYLFVIFGLYFFEVLKMHQSIFFRLVSSLELDSQ